MKTMGVKRRKRRHHLQLFSTELACALVELLVSSTQTLRRARLVRLDLMMLKVFVHADVFSFLLTAGMT